MAYQVGRLKVAMHDARLVHGCQCVNNLPHHSPYHPPLPRQLVPLRKTGGRVEIFSAKVALTRAYRRIYLRDPKNRGEPNSSVVKRHS
eukprot:98937-Pyramimonas_sp.AAC.1